MFSVSDQPVRQPTMAARRRQQGHKHGRRVFFSDLENRNKGDMGAERASRGVLARTMATGRPRQQCANLRKLDISGMITGQRRFRTTASKKQRCNEWIMLPEFGKYRYPCVDCANVMYLAAS